MAEVVNDPPIPDEPDPWKLTGQYAVALGEANSNITATRQCQERQRQGLAKRK